MSVIKISQTDPGSSTYIVPDYFIAPFNIGVQAVVTDGTPEYTIEYTLDDTQADGFSAASAKWNAAPSPFAGATDDTAGSFTIPCRGIRVTVAALTAGTVEVTLCQAGTR
jgi:hypothetical protein